jgi:putative RNA 2'-phosphotransferase
LVDEVVHATRRMHWSLGELTPGRLIDFVQRRADGRFEVYGDRVRARYGHSVPDVEVAEPEVPPEILFHGTSQDALPSIFERGLRPMGRSHVHLTANIEYARSVAHVEGRAGIVLIVEAQRASEAGVAFLRAGSHVWLAGHIEARFIREH